MNKIRKYISLFLGITIALVLWNTPLVYADATIETTATVTGENVVITGQISNATEETQVTFLAGDPENAEDIIYIDQKTCDASGSFTFEFALPDTLPAGTYPYKIGSDALVSAYTGTFTYQGGKQSRKIVDGALNLVISNYTPRLEGVIECGIGKSVTINITNTTDNTVVANDTFVAANGACEISYTLPSLVQAKDYTISITCNDYEKALATAQLSVSSSIVLVSASGTVSTADDVTLDVQIKSVATNLINKSMTVSGTRTLSGTLPNVFSNATYELSIKGYEKYLPGDSVGCRIIGEKNDTVKVIAYARNIKDFENRKFELNYNPAELEAVSLWGAYVENSVGTGRKGHVTILSYNPGKIVFQITDKDIPDGKVWSGVLNLFKFKLTDGYSEHTAITIK